ncbi:MAG: acyltransferase [Bacteroidetes bacterium]|nr:acyltransferase [Bacteroidota bacterium]
MEPTKPIQRVYIEVIESLRGVASLGVVMYHFANSTLPTIKPNPIGAYFEWAKLGIPMFFIISAFIIPYSMYSSGYTLKDAGKFMAKRMARIGPPAYLAIILMAVINYGALMMNGKPIEGMTWPGAAIGTILANLFFSYTLFGTGMYIEVYWTLEIEFQFYLFIALFLPLIIKNASKPLVLSTILGLLSMTYLIHNDTVLFFRDNSFFILGLLLFLYKMKLIERNYFVYAMLTGILLCYLQQGVYGAAGSLIALLAIAFVRFKNSITDFLGTISFSLYITHHFSGVVAEYLLRNITGYDVSDPLKVILLIIYTLIAIAFAYVFYLIIEKPFIRISHNLYSHKPKKPKN